MQERLRTVKGWFVGCALLALASCGGGVAEQSTGTGSESDATSSQEALHSHNKGPKVTPQTSGTSNLLIAVSAVNDRVVWAAGANGTFVVTTNGGKHWRSGVVPGAETVQFRDVQAFGEKVAYLLSVPAGDPPNVIPSRIYRTVDGGKTWKLQFEATADQFHDCFAFWDPWSGVDFADSLGGRFPAVRTFDGHTWHDYGDHLPAPLPGEAGFASSGTCITTLGNRRAWITTGTPPATAGGAWTTRVFFTTDRGHSWGVTTAPISPSGPTAVGGGFSIAFRDSRHGILGGGDLGVAPGVVVDNFARSNDGGRTWTLGTRAPIAGAIFGVAYATEPKHRDGWWWDDDDRHHGHDDDSVRVVATGDRGGAAWSADEGRTWKPLSGLTGLWGVDFGDGDTGWLVGRDGQIVRIDF